MTLSNEMMNLIRHMYANPVQAQEIIDTFNGIESGDIQASLNAVTKESAHNSSPRKQKLVWSATDVTNQYKELRFWAANDSISISTAGLIREEGVDYTISDPRPITITCVADVSASLQSKFFRISSPTLNYYVWFNVDGAGVDPSTLANSGPGVGQISGGVAPISSGVPRTAIPIAITSNSSAATIATAIMTALNTLGSSLVFQVTSPSSGVLTVDQQAASTAIQNLVTPDAGNSGFTISLQTVSISPTRITLRAGGALATGGAAAIIANGAMLVTYQSTLDPTLPVDLIKTNIALHSQEEVNANLGLPLTAPVHYFHMGKGAPVVTFSGGFGDYTFPLSYTRDIAEKFDYYSMSHAYSYRFTWPDDGTFFTPDMQQRSLISFIESLNVGPVHLIIQSSGKNAIRVAQQRPDLIKSLIIASPGFHEVGVGAAGNTNTAIMQYSPSTAPGQLDDEKILWDEMNAMVNGSHSAPFLAATQDQRNLSARILFTQWSVNAPVAGSPRTFTDINGVRTYNSTFQTLISASPAANAAPQSSVDNARVIPLSIRSFLVYPTSPPVTLADLASINKPVLLVTGSLERSIITLGRDAFVSVNPNVTSVVIPGFGFAPNIFAPALFVDAVMNFLKDK